METTRAPQPGAPPSPTHPELAGPPPLIPRAILFGNPERTNPQLSPDGRYLAYLAPDEKDVLQVWLRDLSAGKPGGPDEQRGERQPGGAGGPPATDQVLTADKKRGIHSYFWTYDGAQLVYLQDADGDENFHLYAVNIRSRIVRDLTPSQGIQARLVARDPSFPHELLVEMNLQDRRKHDVYRVNLKNGAVEFDTENPGNVTGNAYRAGWTVDARFQVRAAHATTPDGGHDLLLRDAAGGAWRVARHWGPDDEGYALDFSADGATLYLAANHDANALRLLAVDVATGQETVVAEDPQYDVGGRLWHPTRRVVQAVAFNRERLEWQVLDQDVAADFDALAQIHPGQIGVVSRDLADTTWLVSYATDDGPVYYYTYDRRSRTGRRLFSHQPRLEGLPLAPMQPITYTSRDGLTIHGYLTTPVFSALPEGAAGAPAQRRPLVLLVHGGPWGRDTWGYRPWVQWLANRGYAVLQVNFRGSSGYGKAFLNAGDREWGGKMHDDLIDGVE